MKKLLISTGNKDKIIEIRAEYQDLEYEIISPEQIGLNLDVEETGSTLEENALLKARAGAEASNLLTLADDTGLEVDVLDGRPGIYSARFAGEEATYEDNNQKLLKLLNDYPEEARTACFVTVAALVDPATGREETVRGICRGRIISEFRGDNGFGYDPIFYLPEKDKTFAELTTAEKNRISHRANALKKMKKILDNWN
ncbi:MAG: XTP/dITP diphosphatase [Halanaerobiaceae bacterium]